MNNHIPRDISHTLGSKQVVLTFDSSNDAAQYAKRTIDNIVQDAKPEAPPVITPLTRDDIRAVFMAHGFVVKEGQTDLKEYVYQAAEHLLQLAAAPEVAARAEPQIPEDFRITGLTMHGQMHAGAHAHSGSLWHTDINGMFWVSHQGLLTPHQLEAECLSTVADLRRIYADRAVQAACDTTKESK